MSTLLIDYKKVNVYQGDALILKDVDFKAGEGEFIYIIGKVGSGKSSLLKTMYCELDLDADDTEKAEVLGRDLRTLKRKEIPALRREMGIIFQDFQLLHDRSVYGNLRFVLRATGWKKKDDINKKSSVQRATMLRLSWMLVLSSNKTSLAFLTKTRLKV